MNYGATPDEWAFWDLAEGLTEDLLPVVCKPGEKIYEGSNLKSYGKVPSRYTSRSEVVGFTNWTTHRADVEEIQQWSAEGRYGICLQTRRARALDFDITDPVYATYLRDVLELLGYSFPYRTRADSSKFLTLFYLEGDYGKQTLQTPHGIIEFLATGQQAVVAGTHPSGCRYEWDWCHPIPVFDHTRFQTLLADLSGMVATRGGTGNVSWSDPARSRAVERTTLEGTVGDPVYDYLRDAGLVLRSTADGRAFLRCPWANAHTSSSDLTETCWFSAGTNGFENGHFDCKHVSHGRKEDWEFLDAIGFTADGFEEIGTPVERPDLFISPTQGVEHEREDLGSDPTTTRERSLRLGTEDRSAGSHATLLREHDGAPEDHRDGLRGSGPDLGPDQVLRSLDAHLEPRKRLAVEGLTHPMDLPPFERNPDTDKVKPKLPNIILAFQRPDLIGAVIGWDDFKAETVWKPWPLHKPFVQDKHFWSTGETRSFKDSDYVSLHLALAQLKFGPNAIPTDLIRQSVTWIAERRTFDSAIDWLDALPEWDGVERIDAFCSRYLGTEDSDYTRAVARYWWTAHVARILQPGVQADMAMVLISEQGTRKTSLLRHIPPKEDQFVELDLGERDDDLSRKMRGKMIGEMAELKGINSKDIESLKAWVSRRHEEWVPKWNEFSRSFPRRLVLVGTTNQDEFLADETGNRRWLPMRVGRQDTEALVRDRSQLWAEAVGLYLYHGIMYGDAEKLAKEQHSQYMIHDDWQQVIEQWLTADDGLSGRPADREYLFMNDILHNAIGLDNHQINMSVQFRAGRILRKMGYVKFYKRIDGESHKVWIKATLKLVDGTTVSPCFPFSSKKG